MNQKRFKLITVGTDPEVALFDTFNKEYVRSNLFIGGTKHVPILLSDNGHSYSCDNVMAEFTIPPVTNSTQMWNACKFCIKKIDGQLPKHVEIRIVASAVYSNEQLDDPQANEFFCEPDYNGWTGDINEKPQPNTNLRSAGGHIHLGVERWDGNELTYEDKCEIIRMCDIFLGLGSVIYDNTEASKKRKELYGQAGAFRPKNYGVEYRSLGNFFLRDSKYMDWIFKSLEEGFKFLDSNIIAGDKYRNVEKTINAQDRTKSLKLMRKYNVPLFSMVNSKIEVIKNQEVVV